MARTQARGSSQPVARLAHLTPSQPIHGRSGHANPYLLERKVREKCATLSEKLSAWVSTFPVLAPYSTFIGIFVVVGAITYFSLIIGELVPKRVALSNPEGRFTNRRADDRPV